MEYVKHGQCIFGGCFSKELKNRILCRGGESYDLMQLERIVRENAAATAEGAVAEAVQNSPVTLRGSLCILTGYGRCGSAIHQCLKNWGCTIVVYDRDENACERAKEAGAKIWQTDWESISMSCRAFRDVLRRVHQADCWERRF